MTEAPWVCGNCRSINQPGTARCYSCRAPQALATTADQASVATRMDEHAKPADRARLAAKGGATYRSAEPLALLAQLAIVVVTLLNLVEAFVIELALVNPPDGGLVAVVSGNPLIAYLIFGLPVAWLVAFVLWGLWLARVVANVPALGGGWTRTSPRAAFVQSIVPGVNLYWTTSILRDALQRLSDAGRARVGLLTAWWIALLLAVLPSIGLIPSPMFLFRIGYLLITSLIANLIARLVGSDSPTTAAIVAGTLQGLLLVLAAALAIVLVNHVEELQRRRESLVPATA